MLLIGILFILLATGISFPKEKKFHVNSITINRISILILVFTLALNINIFITFIGFQNIYNVNDLNLTIFNGLFEVSLMTLLFDIILNIVGIFLLQFVAFKPLLNKEFKIENFVNFINFEYSIILLFNILGASLLISSNNFISLFLALELQSFPLYTLCAIMKDSDKSVNAALKYFLLGGLSSIFILLGSAIIYFYSGLTNFEHINVLLNLEYSDNFIIKLGFIIVITGFLFKIAAAPFHMWAPDIYDNVPTIVTSWITHIPKISILLILIDKFNVSVLFNNLEIFLLIGIISLLIGTVNGLNEIRIKRLLAWSSIANIGFILLALHISSLGGIYSMQAYLFYIFQYLIVSVNIFCILLAFGNILNYNNNNKNFDKLSPIQLSSQLKGQLYINPVLTICLIISLLSLIGIPPLIGFYSKYYVLAEAINNGYYFIAFVAIITSVISAVYYLNIINILITKPKSNEENNIYYINNSEYENKNVLSNNLSYTIALLTIIISCYIIYPDILLRTANILALSYFYV